MQNILGQEKLASTKPELDDIELCHNTNKHLTVEVGGWPGKCKYDVTCVRQMCNKHHIEC